MKYLLKLNCVVALFFISVSEIRAQICTGALGDPVINIDFGNGSDRFGSPITETNYAYTAGTPNDGQYTIVKTTAGLNSGWHQTVVNHTPNDPNGYFMVVNADLNKGIFYEKTVQVCEKTTYEFGAYIINILRDPGIKPNIKFTIEYNTTVIELLTNDIIEGGPNDWKQYTKVFTTPVGVTEVKLKMTNENPGGIGNDLAIDDITFRACGPVIVSKINNNANLIADICAGSSATYNFSTTVSTGYVDPVYQWQEEKNNTWIDIPGETNLQTTINVSNAMVGQYRYRLNVAERPNITSPGCRVSSQIFTVRVTEIPNPIATNTPPTCFGADIRLFATNINLKPGDVVSYEWIGPNFRSTDKDPIIINSNLSNAGIYNLTVNVNGCIGTSQTTVQVPPKVTAATSFNEISICEGERIMLQASGGDTFKWSPTADITDVNIANPSVAPKSSTIYTVVVGVGNCFDTKSISVIVNPKTEANAGTDKKILAGQSVELNGEVKGANTSFSWFPTSYLDDPTKLNPIASPPTNITYTLIVNADCGTKTDDVFIKVYPKIEIPNTFSPNGDGVNDTWGLPAIEQYGKIKIDIINRWGTKVFDANSFKLWDGKFQGKDLPTGTYYYNIYLGDTAEKLSGWILLTR
ncbi:MAG: gliding motility-associated C-terminal domain-containing protein [Flavobacterium sp.]|nr:MAG: gliding motility-associated C-terminal domain-containing protein [Flavobacterium sp.]